MKDIETDNNDLVNVYDDLKMSKNNTQSFWN